MARTTFTPATLALLVPGAVLVSAGLGILLLPELLRYLVGLLLLVAGGTLCAAALRAGRPGGGVRVIRMLGRFGDAAGRHRDSGDR